MTILTHPLPFFHHAATGRVFYIAAGPCPLVFSISLDAVAPVVHQGSVIHTATHPFGLSSTVGSLVTDEVRREFADAKPLESNPLDEALSLWANFCDDVADRLNDGETLADALDDTWILCPEQGVVLDDDEPPTIDPTPTYQEPR